MRLKLVNWDIVTAEVPDEITLALNLSQCPFTCSGCHSPQLREDIGRELTWEILYGLIKKNQGEITCICFLGGDSYPEDVAWLAYLVKRDLKLKTAWYSGNTELPKEDKILSSFDYIKVGPYIESMGPLNKETTNQRFYKVTTNKDSIKLDDITSRFWK